MPYNFAADSFHTKKLCSRLSSSEVQFLMKIGRFAFLRPPLGDLGATYYDHLRLIGKRVVDFLLALIELFSLGQGSYRSGKTGKGQGIWVVRESQGKCKSDWKVREIFGENFTFLYSCCNANNSGAGVQSTILLTVPVCIRWISQWCRS